MTAPLLAPPRLRLPSANRDRHATWLELFYDLVFSVAVAALGSRLVEKPSLAGLLQMIALFVPVWWAWVGHTVYDTRFDNDDLFQRLSTLGIMLGAAAMAVAIPFAFEGRASLFATAYVITRAFLLTMYVRAHIHVPEARKIIRLYLSGFCLGAGLWTLAIFLPAPWSYRLWLLGLAIDFVTPWLGLRILRSAPLDTTHVPERFASFTIIVLGVLIAMIVSRVTGPHVQPVAYLAALFAFCLTVCVWWLYFTFLDVAPVDRTLGPGQPFIYVHLPLVLGLIILGVALELVIGEAGRPHLSIGTRWFLGLGLVLWLLAGLALKLVMTRHLHSLWLFVRIGLLICAIMMLTVGALLPPLVVLGTFVGLLVIFVGYEVQYLRKMAQQEEGGKRA